MRLKKMLKVKAYKIITRHIECYFDKKRYKQLKSKQYEAKLNSYFK